jgi:flagellar biogenesis protein FliO
MLCFASAVIAAPPASPANIESQPIRRAATNDSPQAADTPDTDHSGNFELPRVAGALAIVLALIFILRWGGLRIFNSPASQKASRSVQVLSRSVLAPRQHILLVQVGKRVLVVGDSGGQMSSLCQITDPDEIAGLVGQIRDEKLSPATGAFKSIFRRQKVDGEEPSASDMRDDWTENNIDVPATDQVEEQELSETRSELSGLMDKVRLLSKQMKS